MSLNSTLTAGHGPSPEHLQGQVGVTPTPPQALPAQLDSFFLLLRMPYGWLAWPQFQPLTPCGLYLTLLPRSDSLVTGGPPVVTYGCETWTIKKADPKELMLLNGVGEDA